MFNLIRFFFIISNSMFVTEPISGAVLMLWGIWGLVLVLGALLLLSYCYGANNPKLNNNPFCIITISFKFFNCVTQLMLYTGDKLSSTIFCCLSVCEVSITPDQISTFSNIYRHTSPLLTMYHLIPSSTNLYWPSTSQYRYILTQYHQVPLIIHHLVRHSSVNWIIPLFTTHLMSHAQYTWSSSLLHSFFWV